jgi:hypothetical protein
VAYVNSKIKIYQHIFLSQDKTWIFLLLDQLKYMEDSHLFDIADEMIANVVGDKDQFELAKNILRHYEKIQVTFNENSYSEVSTLKKLWLDANKSVDEYNILYLHLKGVTSFSSHFTQNQVDLFRNIYYWRKFSEWSVIEKWQISLSYLMMGNQIVGCNFNEDPLKHFSGNMWWAKSSYIKSLDDIENSAWWKENKKEIFVDRLIAEMWPCSKATKIFSLSDVPEKFRSPNMGLYSEPWLRKYYEKLYKSR